jgi:PAS domain S-box-containing protein
MNRTLKYAAATLAGVGIGSAFSRRHADGNGNHPRRSKTGEDLLADGDWLRLFYESVEDYAIFLLDSEGNIASWNRGAQNMFGYKEAEIIGRSSSVLYLPEERASQVPEKEWHFASRSPRAEDERWHLRKDGTRFFASGILKTLRDATGAHKGFVKIIRDITVRKEMEERLKASEAHFHQLADAMPQIAFTARPDGYVDYFNQQWFDYSGFSEEQTYARDGWSVILHPDDKNTIGRWYEIVRAGQPFTAEERYKDRRTGSYRWFLRRALPVRDESGKVIRWFGTATDITDQKETQLALARAKEELKSHAEALEHQVSERTGELKESVESMEGILYHVAHDLRAPLRAMHGFTTILLRQCSSVLDAEGIEFGQRISEAASRMDDLIQDLLSYGRLSQAAPACEPISLTDEIQTALRLLDPQIQSARGAIRVDPPIPSVMANRTLLGEIIVNLITNALKFTRPGVPPLVHIWAEERNGMVRLSVKDNGIGIAPEYQEKIFGMFQRLHSRDAYPGTGIGLAIVARGVQRMGGKVGVESKPGEGSRFWFELPKA